MAAVVDQTPRRTTRRLLTSVAALGLLLAAACAGETNSTVGSAQSAPSVSTERWMQELFEERPETRLSSLLLPGSHDAGAVDISVVEPCSVTWIDGVDPRIIEAADDHPCRAGQIAKAQNLALDDQLRAGIRYLDLRVGTALIDDERRLVIHHDVVAQTLEAGLDDILEVASTSGEFFVLDFQSVAISDPSSMEQFVRLIGGLCDVAIRIEPGSVDTWARTATLTDVWAQAPRNSLVLVPDNVPDPPCAHERMPALASPWPDTTDPDAVRAYAEAVLERRSAALESNACITDDGNDCGFFVSQLQLSPALPATNRVLRCLEFDIGLCSLEAAAELVNESVGGWVAEWCAAGLPVNIAIVDFIETSDLVTSMIEVNRQLGRDGCT